MYCDTPLEADSLGSYSANENCQSELKAAHLLSHDKQRVTGQN
jgi:hypothetical protein